MQATTAELAKINSRLPEGAVVQSSQVEILPFMMFDDKETDRSTTMSIEMMKKLVFDLDNGVVAMNSLHKSNSTLPAGRSVEGLMANKEGVQQVLAKMYVVTNRPDGSIMEDGKDLADRYNTGAVFACSAGVYVGFYKCNICGNDIRDYQHCDHWPGEVYQIDEKPIKCIASMTGHDIQNGMAMDCGAYELSAVTAGGVRNASILTETFGKFQDGANVADFKKGAFESKDIVEHIAFIPALNQLTRSEEPTMSLTAEEVKKLALEAYSPMVQEHAKLTLENTQYQSKVAELETGIAGALAKVEEFRIATEAAVGKVTEFSAQVETLTAEKTTLTEYRTAFEAVVATEGTKIGQTADFASKTLVELQELYTSYQVEVAKLPAGQQSTSDVVVPVMDGYTGIPESCFKTK